MKAVVCNKYGGPEVLEVKNVSKPTPKKNEVLIKVYASSLTQAEAMMRKGEPRFGRVFLGLTKPKHPITGTGFSGKIVGVGEEVKEWAIGQEVFGETAVNFSANAEYLCVPEKGIILEKPENITHEEAAPLCDGAITSYNFLTNLTSIKKGQHVLVNGASGSLGIAAIQIAKATGAQVTAVCGSKNVEWIQAMGIEKVIDYTKEDFTRGTEKYDIIFDTVGKIGFRKSKRVLKSRGEYLSPVLSMKLLGQMFFSKIFGNKKAKFQATGLKKPTELKLLLNQICNDMAQGKFKSIVEGMYTFENVVKAHEIIDSGHKRANLVLLNRA